MFSYTLRRDNRMWHVYMRENGMQIKHPCVFSSTDFLPALKRAVLYNKYAKDGKIMLCKARMKGEK